jgi:L-ascorbate metabolism protein UlaG (beta-lactamase superfamily)
VTIGPKRLVEVALGPDELPPIDAVLLSHAHMDSLDPPSLAKVSSISSAAVLITPERTADLVDGLGYARVVELPWEERTRIGGVAIEAVKLRHWGERWPWDAWRGYNGYVLSKGDLRVLFASDTAYTEAIGALGRARRLTVAILGNGAYDPWIRNHANPEQVWKMFRDSGAHYLVPIHWDTFRLGKEPVGDAMKRLFAAAGSDRDRIVVRQIGGSWSYDPAAAVASGGG